MNIFKGWKIILIAFVLAVLSYWYISNQIYKSEEKMIDPSYKLIKLTAKDITVKVRLSASPPEGYQIVAGGVKAEPEKIVVIGPEALLESTTSAETALVDVSDYTKDLLKNIPLENVAGIHLTGDPYFVKVTVPIKKTETEQ